MTWTDETQARFDALRLRELTGQLIVDEQAELARLTRFLEQVEETYLMPAIETVRREQAALLHKLQTVQNDNEELAKLLHQQEQLATEARHWLQDFQERHRRIQRRYTHLTGETLTTA